MEPRVRAMTLPRNRRLPCLLLIAHFLLLCSGASAQNVIGCGGFVQLSPTIAKLRKAADSKVDFSQISVELRTADGLVKDLTQCAPNGYYFLPVDDKGTFNLTIIGPEGWFFEPNEATVTVDQESCNASEDTNFQLTGFAASGRVLGTVGGPSCQEPESAGPAGVIVNLTPIRAPDGTPHALRGDLFTNTDASGNYRFPNLPPGPYMISTLHSTWTVGVKGSDRFEVTWGSIRVDDIFHLAGVDLQGSVQSQGTSVPGVDIFLFSDDVPSVPCPPPPGAEHRGAVPPTAASPVEGRKYLCHVETQADGTFGFPMVPCGAYTVVPYYKGEVTVFEVSPANATVSVGYASAALPSPFQVTGFSIGGRVLDGVGSGIANVEISVDGEPRVTTNKRGKYRIDLQVTKSLYTIAAHKKHFEFPPLERLRVLPNLPALPDIAPAAYGVCGRVELAEGGAAAFPGPRRVTLTDGPEGFKPQAKAVDEDGSFCFMVPPGEYTLSPVVSAKEKEEGLLFVPASYPIRLKAKPVTAVTFKQGSLSISGKVSCKDLCDPSVAVTLTPAGGAAGGKAPRTVSLKEDSDLFRFEGVAPGRYSLEVKKDPPKDVVYRQDEWCWEENAREVEVVDADVGGVHFNQTGWIMRINSTHPTNNTYIMHEDLDSTAINITKGMQELCLNAAGSHMMVFLYPCVFFGSLMVSYDTSFPELINLVGSKYVIDGEIHIDSRVSPHASNLSDYIYPTVWRADGTPIDQRSFARLRDKANDTHPVAVYEYAHWGELRDRLVIEPRHNGRLQEEVKMEEDYERELQQEQERQDREGGAPEPPDMESLTPEQRDLAERMSAMEEKGTSLKDFMNYAAAQNPAVLGKPLDLDELDDPAQRQARKLAKDPEEPEEVEEPEEGETKSVMDMTDEELGIIPLSEIEENAEEEDEEEAEPEAPDPYEGMPLSARPLPEDDDEWPPLKKFLFYPRRHEVHIEIDGCQPKIPVFVARLGLYLEGRVEPALPGVNVTVVAMSDGATGGFRKGDVVLSTLTQQEGLFCAGPLYDDATYGLEAAKTGYALVRKEGAGEFDFEAKKLASIRVTVEAGEGAEGELPPVLCSLSGDEGYRRNAHTPGAGAGAGAGEGAAAALTFEDLLPGTFYVRPLLKEYDFDPSTAAVELGPGEAQHVRFVATRVAFRSEL